MKLKSKKKIKFKTEMLFQENELDTLVSPTRNINSFRNKMQNLMGDVENEQDEKERIESFGINFNRRHQSTLGFQPITLNETIGSTLKCAISERELLAIYLHDDSCIAANLFANTIKKAKIAEYLNEKFIIYGFDCTSEANLKYMQQLLIKHLINYNLSPIGVQNLPVLLIVGRFNGTNEILSTITINTENIRQELENSINEFMSRNPENLNYLNSLNQVEFSEAEIDDNIMEIGFD